MTRGVGIAKRGFGKALSRTGYSAGGEVMDDMPEGHESMESLKEEAKEGYKETKGGKMVKDFAKGVEEGVKKVAKVPKEVSEKIVKTLKKVDKKIKEDPGIMGTGDPQRKFKKSKSPEVDEPMKPMKKGGLVKKKK
jgi:gas vesicle protein